MRSVSKIVKGISRWFSVEGLLALVGSAKVDIPNNFQNPTTPARGTDVDLVN